MFISFIYERELAGAGTNDVIAAAILSWRRRISNKLEEAAAGRHYLELLLGLAGERDAPKGAPLPA